MYYCTTLYSYLYLSKSTQFNCKKVDFVGLAYISEREERLGGFGWVFERPLKYDYEYVDILVVEHKIGILFVWAKKPFFIHIELVL